MSRLAQLNRRSRRAPPSVEGAPQSVGGAPGPSACVGAVVWLCAARRGGVNLAAHGVWRPASRVYLVGELGRRGSSPARHALE